MLARLEHLVAAGKTVPPEMHAAFERQTGRKLSIPQFLAVNAVKAEAPAVAPVEAQTSAGLAPASIPAAVKVSASPAKGMPDHGQFTGIPDAELAAFAAATDGMEAAGGVAVIIGLRRALRAAFKCGASAAPYGPAVVTQGDIANLSFCSLATVKRWLRVLECAGIVRIERAKKPSGDNYPSTYTMLFRVGNLGGTKGPDSLVHNEPRGQRIMSGGVSSRPQKDLCATSEEKYETMETGETHAGRARDGRSVSFSLVEAKAMADADTPARAEAWCRWVDYLNERSLFGRATIEAQRDAFNKLGDDAPAAVANAIVAHLRRLCLPNTAQRSTATPSEMPEDLKIF